MRTKVIILLFFVIGLQYNKVFAFESSTNFNNNSFNPQKAKLLPDIVVGNKNAPITLIEYSSINCTHCADLHNSNAFKKFFDKFVRNGKIKLIYRHYPLDNHAIISMAIIASQPESIWLFLIYSTYKNYKQWLYKNNGSLQSLCEILISSIDNHLKANNSNNSNQFINDLKICKLQLENLKKEQDFKKYINPDLLVKIAQMREAVEIPGTPSFMINYFKNGQKINKNLPDDTPENIIKNIVEIINSQNKGKTKNN